MVHNNISTLIPYSTLSAISLATSIWNHTAPTAATQILIQKCIELVSSSFGRADARVWGLQTLPNDFPTDIADKDNAHLIRCNFDIIKMAKEKQQALLPSRLNISRIKIVCDESLIPDKDKNDFLKLKKILLDFADEGVEIPTPTDFTPSNISPPTRKSYAECFPAVHALLFEFIEKGLAIVIDADHAARIPPNTLHLGNSMGWAVKANKASGRQTGDLLTLNFDEGKAWCSNQWGPVEFPSIVDFIVQILELKDIHGLENISIYEHDITGAHQLLFFKPKSTPLVTFELLNGFFIIFLAGIFGWNGMSFAFNIISKLLGYIFRARMPLGRNTIYSDNILGVCPSSELNNSFNIIETTVADLLGPASITPEKRKSCQNDKRSMVALGWEISLLGTICPASKSLAKGIGYFYSIDLSLRISLIDLQRLAAFGYYFCKIFPELRFLLGDLYFPLRGVNFSRNKNLQINLTPSFITAVLIWRAALTLYLSDHGFERPLEDFRIPTRAVLLEFDGAPHGGGFRIWKLSSPSGPIPHIDSTPNASGSFAFSFGPAICHISIYQNACELLALTLGLLYISTMQNCATPTLIHLRGDSVTALEWATNSSFQIGSSRATVMLLVETCRRFKFVFAKEYQLVPTDINWRCDSLSRLEYISSSHTFALGDQYHLPSVDLKNSQFSNLIDACDPRIPLSSVEDLISHWQTIRNFLH